MLHTPDGVRVGYDTVFGTGEASFRTVARFNGDATTDAFGRLRTSQIHSIFDSKQCFDEQTLYFCTASFSGGTVTYQSASASSVLTTVAGATSRALRQSRRAIDYRPGKSQQANITATFVGGGQVGVDKRVGLFDDNNGLFFMMSGTNTYVGCRSDTSGVVVDTVTSQSAWNIDKMDGTGKSGLTVDWSKSQIFTIDYQWLGVGSIRYGLFLDGREHHVHEKLHANDSVGVFMRFPNLPVRWETKNTQAGASGSIEAICCAVGSEGGFEPIGRTTFISNGITGRSATQTQLALLAIRLKPTHLRATVVPTHVTVFTSTKDAVGEWTLMLNPELGGTDTWVNISGSALQYSVTKTSVTSSVNTAVLAGGYLSTTDSVSKAELDGVTLLGSDYQGNSDVLAVVVRNIVAGAETYFAALEMRELT